MKIFFKSFLFVLLFLKPQFAFNQEYVTDIGFFGIAEGLSQTTVNVIFQDSKGFLWIGTQGGLNRYDGYTFKVYNPQYNNINSISSNYITSITEDKKGNIWIGTRNGLNCLKSGDDKFIRYHHDSSNPFSIASDEIQGVYIDKASNLWIKTPETIEKMDVVSGHFFHYPFFDNVFNFDNDRVNCPLLEDKQGKFWVGTKDGLNYFDRGLLLFDRYSQASKSKFVFGDDNITALLETRENEFWVGTDNGLYIFDRETKTFSQQDFMKQFKGRRIRALLETVDGKIWVGTDKGVILYNPDLQKQDNLRIDKEKLTETLQSQVMSFVQDRSGIIWIGFNRGLAKLNIHAKRFSLISKDAHPSVNLTSDDIASIYRENENTLWIGTWGNGLNILDLTTNTVRKYDLASQGGNSNWNYIHSIFRDKQKNIWLGTRDGVLHFNPLTGKAHSICDEYNIQGCLSIKNNRISQIVEDSLSNLWFATHYGLLKLNNRRNDIQSWLHSPEDSSSMPSNTVYSIKRNSKGYFYIATDKGLVKFDPITGQIIRKSSTLEQEKHPGYTTLYNIEMDEENNVVWGGSENGLIKFDYNCNIIKIYSDNDQLSGNIIYSILKDDFNNLWLSTNRGISKFNIQNESFVNYDLNDGLQNYEFNLGAYLKDNKGNYFFGGISGINVIRPDSVEKHVAVPNIVVTYIELFDKKGIKQSISPVNNTITVPYGTSLITLDFAALDFSYPIRNQFKYKFYSGEEPDWIQHGNRHTVTLTSLRPGRYKFKLIGSSSDMVWNENGIEYDIIIQSPFWLTTMAYWLYGIISVLLFLAIYQFRTFQFYKTNRLLKQQELIAKAMQQQKDELTIKNKNITDSINYAKRIQEALMPSEKQIKKAFPNSFVLLKPKDIVSGDFFWISERNDKVFVAAIDCTGHGVPGAFMSIIGYELFRKVTNNQHIENASEMLTLLNEEFESIFKDVANFTLRDGMDIAFVVIDKKKRKLEFSGAINPMYLIRNNKVMEVRGSRFSIGIEQDIDREQTFDNCVVELEPDDIFYLFSDGYADQFGGPEGKKFKYRRFRHLLLTIHKFPMDEQLQLLEDRLDSWKGELEQVDDILILGIKPFSKGQ